MPPPEPNHPGTPEERASRAERTRIALREWNGYNPSESELVALDAELDRRLHEAGVR
ncbi:hypothetical protein ACGFZZ_31345 [Streptomyces tendae]|uniref:hypothetical protein n=1 Tax=Streptomyces tendae TaxID=1932 RepID=UPI0037237A83